MSAQRRKKAVRTRPYGGALPAERRNLRRGKLIAAGYKLFGSSSFNDTGIGQICAAAGVGIRAFYDEFESLEGLLLAVYDDVMSSAYGSFKRSLFEPPGGAAKMLERGIRTYLHEMLDNPCSGRIASIESARLDPLLGRYRNKMLKKFARLVATVVQADAATFDGDIRVWSLMFAGGLNEVVVSAVLSKPKPDIDALASSIAEICTRTLAHR